MIFVRTLVTVIQGLTATLMLIAVALNSANIIGRYVLFRPIASAEEIMLFLLVGTVFLGNAIVGCQTKGGQQICSTYSHRATSRLYRMPTYGVVRKSRKTHNERILLPTCSFSSCSPVRSSCARGVGGAP